MDPSAHSREHSAKRRGGDLVNVPNTSLQAVFLESRASLARFSGSLVIMMMQKWCSATLRMGSDSDVVWDNVMSMCGCKMNRIGECGGGALEISKRVG